MVNFENQINEDSISESIPEVEQNIASVESSEQLAKELLSRHESEIRANLQKDVDGWGNPYTDYQDSTRHFLETIPEVIRQRYYGHGITRKGEADRLAAALNIMANKSIKGECGPLSGANCPVIDAYQHRTEFLVISKIDNPLPLKPSIFNKAGQWKADIGAVIVNVKYYPLVNELRELFPEINIIKANELQEYFPKE
jgi:hypothetical protein